MNRTTKTIVSILGIVVAMAVLSLITYYAGDVLSKSFIGTTGIKHSEWTKLYHGLVVDMGIISGIVLLLWYLLARFVLRVDGVVGAITGAGKRAIWAVLFAAEVVICFVAPFVYSSMHHSFTVSIVLSLLFIVAYALVGYWLVGIFVTPDAYKYTPLGGMKFRAPKGRK